DTERAIVAVGETLGAFQIGDVAVLIVGPRLVGIVRPGPAGDRPERLVQHLAQETVAVDGNAGDLAVGVAVGDCLAGWRDQGSPVPVRVGIADGLRDCRSSAADSLGLSDHASQSIVAPGQGVIRIAGAGQMTHSIRASIVAEGDCLIGIGDLDYPILGIVSISSGLTARIGRTRQVTTRVVDVSGETSIGAALLYQIPETVIGVTGGQRTRVHNRNEVVFRVIAERRYAIARISDLDEAVEGVVLAPCIA